MCGSKVGSSHGSCQQPFSVPGRGDGDDTNHTRSHFFNPKYPNDRMDNRTRLSHGVGGEQGVKDCSKQHIDRLMDGPRAFW